MACNSCASAKPDPSNDPRWRRAVWIALIINATMFGVEIFAGVTAHSAALKADALDFLGDSANYAISLGVAGMVLTWRARAAMLKGATLFALGVWVIGSTGYAAFAGTLPQAETMGIVGGLALAANVAVAFILYRFRSGEANMRSVWICSRNDAIGNVAVVAAAFGCFSSWTGTSRSRMTPAWIPAPPTTPTMAAWASGPTRHTWRSAIRTSPGPSTRSCISSAT